MTVYLVIPPPKILRVSQNRVYAPCMTVYLQVYLVIPPPKILHSQVVVCVPVMKQFIPGSLYIFRWLCLCVSVLIIAISRSLGSLGGCACVYSYDDVSYSKVF